MKRLGYILSFLLIGMLMPLAIWVAAFVAIRSNHRPKRPAEQLVPQY